jgi:hypothetical protein
MHKINVIQSCVPGDEYNCCFAIDTKSTRQNEYLVYCTLTILRRLRVSAAAWEDMEPLI